MDGSSDVEPARSIIRLLLRAKTDRLGIYVFGRFYKQGDGIHDVHMNQGSTQRFLHRAGDDHNDHNDVWQDGAVLVDMGNGRWAAYFSGFQQQLVPTDGLGNPSAGAKPLGGNESQAVLGQST